MSQAMDAILKTSGFQELRQVPQISKDCITATILRNPIERFISAYIMIITDQRHNKDSIFRNARLTPETLERFIGLLEKRFFDGHLRPQVDFLPVKIDLYLIQERIDKDIKKIPVSIPKEFTPKGKLTKINAQDPRNKKLVRSQLTPKLIKRLKAIYKEDFELYARAISL